MNWIFSQVDQSVGNEYPDGIDLLVPPIMYGITPQAIRFALLNANPGDDALDHCRSPSDLSPDTQQADGWGGVFTQAKISFTTLPATSVRRKSLPE
jgi:hypothetical protein